MSDQFSRLLCARAVRLACGRSVLRLAAPELVAVRATDDDAWSEVETGAPAGAILSTPGADDHLVLTDGASAVESVDLAATWRSCDLPGRLADLMALGGTLTDLRLDTLDGCVAAATVAVEAGETVARAGGATGSPWEASRGGYDGLTAVWLDRLASGAWAVTAGLDVARRTAGCVADGPVAPAWYPGPYPVTTVWQPQCIPTALAVGRAGVRAAAVLHRVPMLFPVNGPAEVAIVTWRGAYSLTPRGWYGESGTDGGWFGPWYTVATVDELVSPYIIELQAGGWECGWRTGDGAWHIYRAPSPAGPWSAR